MKLAILVDANIYLELYSRSAVHTLAPALARLPGLFISRQVVQEVERNRVGVVVALLKGLSILDIKEIGAGIPQQFASMFDAAFLRKVTGYNHAAERISSNLPKQLNRLLASVAEGSDPVSIELQPILERAIAETPEQMSRARARRERGTPPGKPNDPLGDQITWEQFLSYVGHERPKRVVIVTRDEDYGATWRKQSFLDPVLASELQSAAPGCKIEIYGGLADAIEALRDVAGAKVPSAVELQKVKKSEEEAAASEFRLADFLASVPSVTLTIPGAGLAPSEPSVHELVQRLVTNKWREDAVRKILSDLSKKDESESGEKKPAEKKKEEK